ncbi:MAG: hypothetical protein HYX35_03895 [Proteobacteria bacterium]|nr:hypothetical protein [Pseudomonadota bacterium]
MFEIKLFSSCKNKFSLLSYFMLFSRQSLFASTALFFMASSSFLSSVCAMEGGPDDSRPCSVSPKNVNDNIEDSEPSVSNNLPKRNLPSLKHFTADVLTEAMEEKGNQVSEAMKLISYLSNIDAPDETLTLLKKAYKIVLVNLVKNLISNSEEKKKAIATLDVESDSHGIIIQAMHTCYEQNGGDSLRDFLEVFKDYPNILKNMKLALRNERFNYDYNFNNPLISSVVVHSNANPIPFSETIQKLFLLPQGRILDVEIYFHKDEAHFPRETINQILSLPNLGKLGLRGDGHIISDVRPLESGFPRIVSQLGNWQLLYHLEIEGHRLTAESIKAINRVSNLRNLTLSYCTFEGKPVFLHFSHLQTLNISHTPIMDESLISLMRGTSLQRLSLLCSFNFTGSFLRHSTELPNLTQLNLSHTPVTDKFVSELGKIHSLRDINLSHTDITGSCLPNLAELPNLRKLNLSHTPVTDKCVSVFENASKLETLNLCKTKVTDVSILEKVDFCKGEDEKNEIFLFRRPSAKVKAKARKAEN